jgi:signal transduction histidine kinase
MKIINKLAENWRVCFIAFRWCLILMIHFLMAPIVEAQEKISIQLKTFDQAMAPYPNVDVSVNGKAYVSVNNKGVGFTELTEGDLPVRNIRIKNDQLEAASWNYGKGTLEIMIRKKNYQLTPITIKDESGVPVSNMTITYNGRKSITVTSDAEGRISIPLALGEVISTATQFTANGYAMIKFISSSGGHVLTVSRLQHRVADTPAVVVKRSSPKVNKTVDYNNEDDFNLSAFDTVESMAGFYAVIKNYNLKKLNRAEQRQLDATFNSLLTRTQQSPKTTTSISSEHPALIEKVSDSSLFSADIKNMATQARLENKIFDQRKTKWDSKIGLINKKLSNGSIRLDERARNELRGELSSLQNLLIENESRFFKNQNDYRLLINSIKAHFPEFQNLKEKLTINERQRLEKESIDQQRVLAFFALAIVFALLVILFIYFSAALRRRKTALLIANDEIRRINENLESLILKRTRLLQSANKELDTFLHRASHDLRTPVRSILGLCNLADKLGEGERTEFVDRIADTSENMDRLLNKLSIINEINQPSNFTLITLSNVVERIRQSFHWMIKEKKIEVVVRCNEFLVFHTYPYLLEAILSNVVENALYFSSVKKGVTPKVEIGAEIKDMSVVIKVKDNGIGIGENVKDKLFDMFFKGSELSKGNGLGLYIVQKAVKVLDGKIIIESIPGQFTECTIILPLKSRAEIKREQVAQAELV